MESILLKSLASKKVTYLDRPRVTCQEREQWAGVGVLEGSVHDTTKGRQAGLGVRRGGEEWSLLTRGGNRAEI